MGNASERRIERVKSLLQSTLADVIRDELADPRLGIFSMTELHLSRDLSHCDILIATVGGREATEQTVLALNGASKLLWNRVREGTDLRSVPKLNFKPDHRGEYSDHIFTLLEQLPPPAEEPAETEAGQAAGTEDDH